jgi:hypothetical protein
LDSATFSYEEIANLYRRRWEVETHYRDEKVHLDIETFHTRGVNGIHQELFAVAIKRRRAKILAFQTALLEEAELHSEQAMIPRDDLLGMNRALAMVRAAVEGRKNAPTAGAKRR